MSTGMTSPVSPGSESETTRTDANLLSRFDRLPVTRTIIGIIVLLSVVWLIESFDIGIVSTLVLVLKPHWHLNSADTGLLGASATIGLVAGIFPAGRLADRFGRKRVLIAGVATFSVFTLLSTLSTSIWMLFALRVIAGFGEGAVFPLPYTILSELVNKKARGTLMGWTNGVLNAGYTLPALAGFLATSSFSWQVSWRVPLYIGGGLIVILPALIKWIPETPRFLLKRAEMRQRDDDRVKVRKWIEKLEDEAGLPHDESVLDEEAFEVLRATKRRDVRIGTLMRPPYLSRSIIAWCAMCSSFVLWYTMLTYAPILLKSLGAKGHQALLFTAIMMLISGFGTLAQGWLGDRWGRRKTFGIYIAIAAVGMIAMAVRHSIGLGGVVIAGVLVAWFGLGSFAVCKIYTAEQYPTRLRGLGTSTAEMITRGLTGGLLVYFFPQLIDSVGAPAVFVVVAVLMVILAGPIVFFGHETSGGNMEVLGTPITGGRQAAPVRSAVGGAAAQPSSGSTAG